MIKRITNLQPNRQRQGLSLVDTVLSLAVMGILVVVFAGLANVRSYNRRIVQRVQAAAIANEQLSALKRFDSLALPTQTNGPFLGMLYNAGSWKVTTDASAGHSASQVVELAKANGFSNAVSGRLLFPAGSYGDATLETNIILRPDTGAGTAAGFFFRASDAKNGYRFLVAPTGTDLDTSVTGQQNWILERVVNGSPVIPRILSVNVAGITTNAWFTVSVVFAGSSLKTYFGPNEQDSGVLTDDAFTDGPAAVIGWNGAHLAIDDVTTTVGGTPSTWDFEGVASLPAAWVRLGLNDLPDATPTVFDDNGQLTLTPYPNTNSVGLKQATLTVSWQHTTGPATYTITALLGSSKIGL